MLKGDDEIGDLLAQMSSSQYGFSGASKESDAKQGAQTKTNLMQLVPTPATEVLRYKTQNMIKAKFSSMAVELGIKLPNASFEKWQFTQKLREEEAVGQLDPLLPSNPDPWDPTLMAEMMEKGTGLEQARQACAELANFTRKSVSKLAKDIAVAGQRKKQKKVTVRPAGPGVLAVEQGSFKLKINQAHYEKMKALYEESMGSFEEREFQKALFSCLLRYETLQGGGFQAALPEAVFDYLLKRFGCNFECFASPFNSKYSRYCSAFEDTDKAFGSVGSFFNFQPASGVFEANPPFVPALVSRMASYIEGLMEATNQDLMFIIIIPAWKNENAWEKLKESKFLKQYVELDQKSHGYFEGKQQLRQTKYRIASSNSSIFFLQTKEAERKWPLSNNICEELKECFSSIKVAENTEHIERQGKKKKRKRKRLENTGIPEQTKLLKH